MLGHKLVQTRSPKYVRSYTKVTEKSLADIWSRKSSTVNVLAEIKVSTNDTYIMIVYFITVK